MKSYFGQKDLLHSKTSALSSRTSSSQLSRSGSSDKYLGYSLITNDSCVSTHRARVLAVATVTCITAVSLVVVIVVMTLTNNDTEQSTDKKTHCQPPETCNPEASCHDYIIVGGGLAGVYAAWKLRVNNTIHLFEGSGRIGGNLHTQTFPFLPEVKLEVGLPYFTLKLHAKTVDLVNTLGLSIQSYYGPHPEERIKYYMRGEGSTQGNLSANILRRYRLSHRETEHLQQLIDQGIEKGRHIPAGIYLLTKGLQQSTPLVTSGSSSDETTYDSQLSVRMALLEDASYEGYNCMRDTSRQMDFIEEASARQFTELFNKMEDHNIHYDTLTLEEGMQRLPELLVEQTRINNTKFQVHMNHKLISLTKDGESLNLKFSKDVPKGPVNLVQEEVNVCGNHVILALPPTELRQVQLPFDLPSDFSAIQPMKGLMIYLMFNGTLYPQLITNGTYWMYTDTPLGDIFILNAIRNISIVHSNATNTTTPYPDYNVTSADVNGTMDNISTNQTSSNITVSSSVSHRETTQTTKVTTHRNATTSSPISPNNITTSLPLTSEAPSQPRYELHPVTVIRAVFTLQEGYYDYWQALLKQGLPVSDVPYSITDVAFQRLRTHLGQVLHHQINDSSNPLLSGLAFNLTEDSDSGPVLYTWKPGYDWSSKPTQLMHPDKDKNVYIVGQAYAPSYNSLGVEGHLSTVDSLLEYVEGEESQPHVTV